MKPLVIALAVVAAIAALFIRPPNPLAGGTPMTTAAPAPSPGTPPPSSVALDSSSDTPSAGAATDSAGANRSDSEHPRAAFTRPATIVVYVAGEVIRPGVYALPAGSRAQAGLAQAGGAKPDADLVAVNLAERLEDGSELAVPKIGDDPAVAPGTAHSAHAHRKRGKHHHRRKSHASDAATIAEAGSSTAGATAGSTSDAGGTGAIDLNTADADQLQTLPGIGATLAERIVAYRRQNGPFRSIDELADVAGVTPAMAARAENLIVVR